MRRKVAKPKSIAPINTAEKVDNVMDLNEPVGNAIDKETIHANEESSSDNSVRNYLPRQARGR